MRSRTARHVLDFSEIRINVAVASRSSIPRSLASTWRHPQPRFVLVRFSRVNGERFARVSLTAHPSGQVFFTGEQHLALQSPKLHRCTQEREKDLMVDNLIAPRTVRTDDHRRGDQHPDPLLYASPSFRKCPSRSFSRARKRAPVTFRDDLQVCAREPWRNNRTGRFRFCRGETRR